VPRQCGGYFGRTERPLSKEAFYYQGALMLIIRPNNQLSIAIDGSQMLCNQRQGKQTSHKDTLQNSIEDTLAGAYKLGGANWNPTFQWTA
jgi:hypothetical protein